MHLGALPLHCGASLPRHCSGGSRLLHCSVSSLHSSPSMEPRRPQAAAPPTPRCAAPPPRCWGAGLAGCCGHVASASVYRCSVEASPSGDGAPSLAQAAESAGLPSYGAAQVRLVVRERVGPRLQEDAALMVRRLRLRPELPPHVTEPLVVGTVASSSWILHRLTCTRSPPHARRGPCLPLVDDT